MKEVGTETSGVLNTHPTDICLGESFFLIVCKTSMKKERKFV